MKILIMKIMMIISSVAPFMKNPMSMGFLLLFQTLMMILLMNKMLISSWFAMITFLMMIGGLVIIFTYMSSIASNEKFKIKINLMIVLLISLMIVDEMILENQIKEKQEINFSTNIDLSLIKIYNSKSMFMTIMLVLYLLITMISVSKLVKHHEGPLRSFKK
uniref:NADH dehydrogenase subunit 6 n=2 Tax=Cicadellidae TaxID=30102 RepID=A0A7T1FUE7_9HEMI|nr:NADH dehydrogenase subunit 6 [Mitjaevia protuberanta]YP_010117072.1 NADH dehydrogenase subunit 6 [Gunungidia aurantiifasciata]QJA16317.1 NADH dehydrogenase subunit 6 [Mitjaevia protuberanta]QPM99286.1 NADH dehydrogenase subunit 6 [Gunungidia aurantiifasciata]